MYEAYEKEKFRLTELRKYDSYKLYKVIFEQEKYLIVLPPNLALNLRKFRTSEHKLEI